MNVTFFCRLAGRTSFAASAAGGAAGMATVDEEEEEEEEGEDVEKRKEGTEEVVGWVLLGGM